MGKTSLMEHYSAVPFLASVSLQKKRILFSPYSRRNDNQKRLKWSRQVWLGTAPFLSIEEQQQQRWKFDCCCSSKTVCLWERKKTRKNTLLLLFALKHLLSFKSGRRKNCRLWQTFFFILPIRSCCSAFQKSYRTTTSPILRSLFSNGTRDDGWLCAARLCGITEPNSVHRIHRILHVPRMKKVQITLQRKVSSEQ